MNNFHLHEQLAKDTLHLTDWPLCQVLLMNDKNYPWLVLVPKVAAVNELYQLSWSQQQQLLQEINCASQALQQCQPDKLNIAALGNIVPQLHVHVIARMATDPAWPKPVWGTVAAQPYAVEQRAEVITRFKAWLTAAYESH